MADGTTISALGQGDIKVDLLLGNKYTTVTLRNTLYTLKMALTLISVHQITTACFTVPFKNDACKILSPALKRKLITSIAQVNGLYVIPAQTEESAHVAKLTINELCRALGHVAQGAIQYMVKQGPIEGVELDSASTPEFCEASSTLYFCLVTQITGLDIDTDVTGYLGPPVVAGYKLEGLEVACMSRNARIVVLLNDMMPQVSVIGDIDLTVEHE
jgi:hypothetical protein